MDIKKAVEGYRFLCFEAYLNNLGYKETHSVGRVPFFVGFSICLSEVTGSVLKQAHGRG